MSVQKQEAMNETKVKMRKKIVIIGGGITGLSAARHLDTHADGSYSVTLVEAQATLGGQIVSRRVSLATGEQVVLNGGVDSFDTREPEVAALAEEVGLQGSVIYTDVPDVHVLDGGQPVRLPQSTLDFVRSNLLTWQEKQRVFKEIFVPQKPEDEDESLAVFVTRRLGRAAFEKIVGPLVDGVYGVNLENQSVLTRFPELRAMERDYGGLLRGMFGCKLARKKGAGKTPQTPAYFRFAGGAQTLIDALVNRLGIELRVNTRAVEVKKLGGRYQVVLSTGKPIEADAVILATPANVNAEVLKTSAPESATLLKQIPQDSIGSVSLVFRRQDIQKRFEFTRLVIPSRERRAIHSLTRVSGGANQSVPKGFELFRVFLAVGIPAVVELDEEEIVRGARTELEAMLGITAQPVHAEVFRWMNAHPTAEVGHLELVELIMGQLPAGLFLAGSSYHGRSVSDCIRQGYDTAEFCLQYVENM
jgi:oxygen-dependent protoporphyrinogen oxidase